MNADDLWFPGFCVKRAGSARLLSWRDGEGLIIAVAGELDVANAVTVKGQLRETIAAEGARDVAIDLAGVEFCDVAGLRALLEAQQSAESRTVTCRFVRPSPQTLWLLHFSGLPTERFMSQETG
ncbi:STAS domain-containing protein [Actinoplanes xinjiangensis]|uniref:Anti-anti-sigma factor n=1 Tax=Actinoplanes xinjiangensis TaxID=512350 RepID=A0A316EL05_9ACTN|nr:STAS domain-containing protein [Actinoplanes xinjiangensis]PWK31719.1 anti-anti-sigma factor [Actinoplanes xinjiangensis]GIF43906.1 hypothetical protein Axi01nite_82170 [Actinoplanes xinjiangensis]